LTPETRRKVRQAVKELKYRPDDAARSLRVSQTGTIAVLIADVTNPFFAELVRGVEDAAHQRDDRYNLLLCNTEENASLERRAIDVVLERRIDAGAIAVTGSHTALFRGRPDNVINVDLFAVFFNDAGVGLDNAGIRRLAELDSQGMIAATVSAESAEIGSARLGSSPI